MNDGASTKQYVMILCDMILKQVSRNLFSRNAVRAKKKRRVLPASVLSVVSKQISNGNSSSH